VVEPAIAWFDPPPAPADVPARLASPFDPGEPHPLARRAADALIGALRGRLGLGLDAPGGGKMFGVLVVAGPDGRIGTLRGFSGMLDGAWHVPGFVPPLFDPAVRDAFWPAGERELAELDRALHAVAGDPDAAALRADHAALAARHAAALAALRARHQGHRAARQAARHALEAAGAGDPAARHALDQASRGDTAERRRLLTAHAAERAAIAARLDALDAARA
jgi:tRNA pseudouridine32 synthase/23S rRNA pseudouridine746 synthase